MHLPWVDSINPRSRMDPMSNWNPLVMAYRRIVLSFITVLRCRVGLIHKKIIPDFSHEREGVHLKVREIARRWLAFPHALALSELMHQMLIICVSR